MTQDALPPPPKKPTRDARGRFLPGHSGNLGGRPRKNLDLIGMDSSGYVFGRTIRNLNMNGKIVEMTHSEALMHKLFQLAMNGDTRALIHLQKLIEESNEIVAEAPIGMLEWLDRWNAEPDYKKKDRIIDTVMGMKSIVDALNFAVAWKNQRKRR